MSTPKVASVPKTAEEIQRRMRRVRCDLDDQMDEIVDNARQITEQITDWHSYWNANPWLYLGIAAGLGYVLMPTRVNVDRPVADSLADLARTGAIKMDRPEAERTLLGRAADLGMGVASSVALQVGLSLLSQGLNRILPSVVSGQVPHDPMTNQSAGNPSTHIYTARGQE